MTSVVIWLLQLSGTVASEADSLGSSPLGVEKLTSYSWAGIFSFLFLALTFQSSVTKVHLFLQKTKVFSTSLGNPGFRRHQQLESATFWKYGTSGPAGTPHHDLKPQHDHCGWVQEAPPKFLFSLFPSLCLASLLLGERELGAHAFSELLRVLLSFKEVSGVNVSLPGLFSLTFESWTWRQKQVKGFFLL